MAILAVIGACSHTPQTALDAMDRAESLMENRPDSALAILRNVSPESLHSKADKARCSLLMTMAVDKNYIDTTDFVILKPALDYYILHGTPDQRLKTRYYEGRIWMNQGNDDKALEAFLRAAEDSTACRDSLALARLYIAQSSLYYRQYSLENFIQTKYRACNLYIAQKDTINALECYLHLLNGYTLLNDRSKAALVYKRCQQLLSITPQLIPQSIPIFIIYHLSFSSPNELKRFLANLENYNQDIMSPEIKLDMGYAYQEIGDNTQALRFILEVQNEIRNTEISSNDSIKFNSISSEIFELNNMPQEALDSYKRYVENITSKHNYLFNSGVLFADERHKIELNQFRQDSITLGMVLGFLLIILGVIIIFLLLMYLFNRTKSHKNAIIANKKQLELDITNKITDIQALKYKHELSKLKAEQAEREKNELQLKMELYSQQLINLENEKVELNKLLNDSKALNIEIRNVLSKRMEVINAFLKANITDNPLYFKEIDNYIKSIMSEQEEFFKFLIDSFSSGYPRLIKKCKDNGLTERELGVFCMLCLGLQNIEIQRFMGLARLNAITSVIRNKFGFGRKDGTLGSIIKKMMEEENQLYK
ncbi:MAG: hypothetical protein K2M56_10715 [Muribaculaceae bacterium]|nr:hypothetical protein [Muribaculaceae bacterium]